MQILSKLKNLQGANFEQVRKSFLAKLEKIFIVPANTFDNVKWQFPIGFKIWNCEIKEKFSEIIATAFIRSIEEGEQKSIREPDEKIVLPLSYINQRVVQHKTLSDKNIGYFITDVGDFQNQNQVYLLSEKNTIKGHKIIISINTENIIPLSVYFSSRYFLEATWKNDRRQFEVPRDWREQDSEFQTDCLIFTLFHGQNRITSSENDGVNHRIPFTEQQVEAREKFKSHFMNDFLKDKVRSLEAEKVYQAWLALWRYYHEACSKDQYLTNASLYEIREYFQWRNEKGKMNAKSSDETYTELIGNLRSELKNLASKIAEKVYEYEFLKR